jgi:hypothetical protein
MASIRVATYKNGVTVTFNKSRHVGLFPFAYDINRLFLCVHPQFDSVLHVSYFNIHTRFEWTPGAADVTCVELTIAEGPRDETYYTEDEICTRMAQLHVQASCETDDDGTRVQCSGELFRVNLSALLSAASQCQPTCWELSKAHSPVQRAMGLYGVQCELARLLLSVHATRVTHVEVITEKGDPPRITTCTVMTAEGLTHAMRTELRTYFSELCPQSDVSYRASHTSITFKGLSIPVLY